MGSLNNFGYSRSLQDIIEASRDRTGRPNPWKAAGLAARLGMDPSQLVSLGAMLHAQGAFDDSMMGGLLDEEEDERSAFLNRIDDIELRSHAGSLFEAGLDLLDLETQDGEDLWQTVRDLGLDPNQYRLEDLAARAGNEIFVPDWDPYEDERMRRFTDDPELLAQAHELTEQGLDLYDLELLDGEMIWETVRDLGLDPRSYRLQDLAARLDNVTAVPGWDPYEDDRLHEFTDDALLEQVRILVKAGIELDDLETLDGPELFVRIYRLGLDPDTFDLEAIAAELGHFIDIPD